MGSSNRSTTIDLHELHFNLAALERKYERFYGLIRAFDQKMETKVGQNGYSEDDLRRDEGQFWLDHRDNNPRFELALLHDRCAHVYPQLSPEERAAMRETFQKFDHVGSGSFLTYIMSCAECLESPADEDIFRLGLIGLSINNFRPDFRDTGAVMAELAIAAVRVSINMEPHCLEIAELSADSSGPYPSMKRWLAGFHLYAPKAVRIFDDDFMSYYEGML